MSILALSITPYITSSIIVQLLTIAIPKLEEMQKDGEDGRKKIVAITRYLTVGLALMESTAMAVGFGRQGLLKEFNFVNAAIVVLTLTAGSTFLMWIGERITEKGVGNGISIVLVINIISRIPSDMTTLFTKFVKGKSLASGGLAVVIIVAIILVLVVFVVVLQDGERRIAVQYSQKVMGRRSLRWTVHEHSAESQYCRCYPDYLCIFIDAVPDCDCNICRQGKWNRNRKRDFKGS